VIKYFFKWVSACLPIFLRTCYEASRINALTGIRAIAVIMVFLYHNRKYWRNDILRYVLRFLNEFHTGVSIFFVLSGFLIAYTYADKPLRSKKEFSKYLVDPFGQDIPGLTSYSLFKIYG
jgi:hypothetical protein